MGTFRATLMLMAIQDYRSAKSMAGPVPRAQKNLGGGGAGGNVL